MYILYCICSSNPLPLHQIDSIIFYFIIQSPENGFDCYVRILYSEPFDMAAIEGNGLPQERPDREAGQARHCLTKAAPPHSCQMVRFRESALHELC
jgi:hypothetical protein